MRGMLALAAVIALVGGVVLIGRNQPQQPSTPAPEPETQILMPAKVVIECESFISWEEKDPVKGVVALKRGTMTMGKQVFYIEAPDGVIEQCGLGDKEKAPGQQPGKMKYEFELPRDDTFYVFLRAWWLDNCGDSVYFRIDEGDWQTISGDGRNSYPGFEWWACMRSGEDVAFKLSKGKHALELNVKEDGPRFDKFLVKTDASKPPRDSVDP